MLASSEFDCETVPHWTPNVWLHTEENNPSLHGIEERDGRKSNVLDILINEMLAKNCQNLEKQTFK